MDIVTPDLEDIDAVVDLWIELARSQRAYGSHLASDENVDAIRQTFNRNLIMDGIRVARVRSEYVGFISFSIEQGVFEMDVSRGIVHNLFVTPDHRGRGIGSALLSDAESQLAEWGADVILLEVLVANSHAIEFYRRNGYGQHRLTFKKRVETDNMNDR